MSQYETHVVTTEPTKRQAQALKVLKKAAAKKNPKMPTLAELGKTLGVSAVSARELLIGLEKRGHLIRRINDNGRAVAGGIELIG